jgi:hypothetical protein
MNIKTSIKIELSADDVKGIIINYLENEGYDFSVDDVVFNIRTRYEGYGMAEHPVGYFDGAYVKRKEVNP